MMSQLSNDKFRALADPGRRQILQYLAKEPHTINALAENFEFSRPAVSKHVRILYSAGLIQIKDIGRERHCSIRQSGFKELRDWLNYFDKFWNKKLDALGSFLEKDNPPAKRIKS